MKHETQKSSQKTHQQFGVGVQLKLIRSSSGETCEFTVDLQAAHFFTSLKSKEGKKKSRTKLEIIISSDLNFYSAIICVRNLRQVFF